MTGDQLRAARIARNLTQRELATTLGISTNTLARWERGELPIRTPAMVAAVLVRIRVRPAPDPTAPPRRRVRHAASSSSRK